MRSPLPFLLLPLLPLLAAADTASYVRSERRVAARLRAEGKDDEASETLRLAVVAARRDRLHAEAAAALADLSDLRWEHEANEAAEGRDAPRIAARLLREASKEAAVAGDRRLEARLLDALGSHAEEEAERLAIAHQALDAAIAGRDFGWLGGQLLFEVDVAVAFRILDLEARASLLARGGDLAAARADLDRALAEAEGASLPLTAAELRLRRDEADGAPRAADAQERADSAGKALEAFARRGDLSGLARGGLLLGRARREAGDAKGASAAFEEALRAARELRDHGLEARILGAAAEGGGAEAARLRAEAERAEERRHRAVLRDAEEAAGFPDPEVEAAAVAALAAERTRRPGAAREIDRLLPLLGAGEPERRPLPPERRARLLGLLGGDDALRTVACLEALRRSEAFPVAVDALASAKYPGYVALLVESLARREDFDALLSLLGERKGDADVAAAAALFRITGPEQLPRIRKALEAKPSPVAALWLRGILAREGDAASIDFLAEAARGDDPAFSLDANAVLGRLGFATPFRTFATLPDGKAQGWFLHRVLARAPDSWGVELRWKGAATPTDRCFAARGANLRGDAGRVEALEEENEAFALLYELPRTPAERGICGTGWILRARSYLEKGGDELLWASEGTGLAFDGGEELLRGRKEDPFAAYAAEDLEFHRFERLAGAQTRVLTTDNGSAWATVYATALPETGEIADGSLRLPFRFRVRTREGDDGSLAGKIGHIALSISLAGLVPDAEIRIPGFEPIAARVEAGAEDRLVVTAALPAAREGCGLGGRAPIPPETLAEGTVTLRLVLEKARASMTFPISFLLPPKRERPDLVAEELLLDPAVPRPGEETRITLRVRNLGKGVEEDRTISVRFSVLNPQAPEGRRTIDVRLDAARGWRPGERRTFEARPKVVRDWYMNRYAMSWTLAMGDTRLSAAVDADGAVAEEREDNNAVELEVPLRLPDEEGKRLASEELLRELETLLRSVGEAQTSVDAYSRIGALRTLLGRAKVEGPEIDVARLHVEAAVRIRVERLRVRDALREARALLAEPGADRAAVGRLVAAIVAAEGDLLAAGVPVKADTITYIRNRTQLAANLSGASGEALEFAGILSGEGSESAESLKTFGDTMNRIDGAMQLLRYARDRVKSGEADAGDAIEGMVSIAGGGPGMSKLHQAMLQAELEYVDKGLRKEANALQALSDLIGGDASAQQRLDAACRDVEAHVTAGPFHPDAVKNIALGDLKDKPILGKLLDAILSWK